VKLALAVKIRYGRAAIVIAPGSCSPLATIRRSAAHAHHHHQRWYVNLLQGLRLNAASGVQARLAAARRRLERSGQGDVEEETMTITDPLTAQVADLHGMARDIQSA
jgi:hypothetical protein